MKVYIALIRGLGGRYTFPMTELVRPGTTRNWRSVCNIQAIAEQIGREPSKPVVQAGARRRRDCHR